jgi:threonine dehydratase
MEVGNILEELKSRDIEALDVSQDEIAMSHGRYLIGGRVNVLISHLIQVDHERLFQFSFPERPGALMKFLKGLKSSWNVSLFHYRNFGADLG